MEENNNTADMQALNECDQEYYSLEQVQENLNEEECSNEEDRNATVTDGSMKVATAEGVSTAQN